MLEALVRYLHFMGIIILSATLVAQVVLIDRRMKKDSILRVINLGRVNMAGAVLAMCAGFTLWFWVGKPSEFYSANYLFIGKLFVFFTAGGVASIANVYFRRSARVGDNEVLVPEKIIHIKRLEIAAIMLLPLLAVLMAHGTGHN